MNIFAGKEVIHTLYELRLVFRKKKADKEIYRYVSNGLLEQRDSYLIGGKSSLSSYVKSGRVVSLVCT